MSTLLTTEATETATETAIAATSAAMEQTVDQAVTAQALMLDQTDKQLDSVISKIAYLVDCELAEFALLEAQETKLGNVKDKQHKLSLVVNQVCQDLVGTVTGGRLDKQANNQQANAAVTEYASPVGIIFAVIPMTNPIPNSLYKILNAIKTRNALIISYPRLAVSVGAKLIALVQDVLKAAGLPPQLIQSVPLPSDRVKVSQFMQHPKVDLILATGGQGLVKAALSSGTPAYAVGPGNVPAIICNDAPLEATAEAIIQSKSYDNGIICGSESALIVERNIALSFSIQLEKSGAAVLTVAEKSIATAHWFEAPGQLNRTVVGKSAQALANLAGIKRDYEIKMLVIPCLPGEVVSYGQEKLAPIVAMFTMETEQLIPLAQSVLSMDGSGHTAVVHTQDPAMMHQCALELPVGRMLVNSPSTFGMMGVSTALPLAFMLGSGSWGGNISTEAITWRHLVNIKRLSMHVQDVIVPDVA